MKASIEGEDDEGCGLEVIDNNGIEHWIEIKYKQKDISYHESDEYADKPDMRTVAEDEHVNQARRFARFYVYRERGYETVEPLRNPDRIAAVMLAVRSLSPDLVSHYFGEFYQQLVSYRGEADPVIPTPSDASSTLLRVEQDVYLAEDEAIADSIVSDLVEEGLFEAFDDAVDGAGSDGDWEPAFRSLLEDRGVDVAETAASVGDLMIEGVGPLGLRWPGVDGDRVETDPTTGTDHDRPADARLQVFRDLYEFEDVAEFRDSLVHHLRCQIRDCYIGMEIAPPEGARVQGPGIYDYVGYYKNHDFYPDYHDTRIDVTDWQVEHTPDDLRM